MTEMSPINSLTQTILMGVNSFCNVFMSFFMFYCFVAYSVEFEPI